MSRQRSMEAIQASEYVTIGELVRLTGTRYSTLKFYTEEGFLPFEQEERNLTRRYRREQTVERIAYLKTLRGEGENHPADQRDPAGRKESRRRSGGLRFLRRRDPQPDLQPHYALFTERNQTPCRGSSHSMESVPSSETQNTSVSGGASSPL